jgi:hypothetical protein
MIEAPARKFGISPEQEHKESITPIDNNFNRLQPKLS